MTKAKGLQRLLMSVGLNASETNGLGNPQAVLCLDIAMDETFRSGWNFNQRVLTIEPASGVVTIPEGYEFVDRHPEEWRMLSQFGRVLHDRTNDSETFESPVKIIARRTFTFEELPEVYQNCAIAVGARMYFERVSDRAGKNQRYTANGVYDNEARAIAAARSQDDAQSQVSLIDATAAYQLGRIIP